MNPTDPCSNSAKQTCFASPFRKIWWEFGVRLAKIILSLGTSTRVLGAENVPKTGPLLLVCNHVSHFDPPLLSAHSPRPIDWLAMSELYSATWSKNLFLSLNAIPLRRGTPDRSALREATLRLQAGRVVGIFPEGGLRHGSDSLLEGAPPRRGAGLLARLARCPVLPCAIVGSDRLYNHHSWRPWNRAPTWILFGELLPHTANDKEFSEALSAGFVTLRARAITAGVTPNDLPKSPRDRMQENSSRR